MTAEYKNWQEEFVDINFTDQRLKSRFFKIIDAFAASPGKSTWAATGSRSSAKAAYRFFSITWEHINIYDYLWVKLRAKARGFTTHWIKKDRQLFA